MESIVGNSYARLWIVRVDEPHHVLRRLLEAHEQLSEGSSRSARIDGSDSDRQTDRLCRLQSLRLMW